MQHRATHTMHVIHTTNNQTIKQPENQTNETIKQNKAQLKCNNVYGQKSKWMSMGARTEQDGSIASLAKRTIVRRMPSLVC